MLPRAMLRFWCAESALQFNATLKDACFTYLWPIRMPALSEVLCLRDGPLENLWTGSGVGGGGGGGGQKKNLRKGNFSLISLIQTNKYFYQFSRFFQNILQFRAFHCSQWKTRFSSSFRREYLNFHLSKRNEPELARYQSVKCARCSPDVLWAPVKNTESQNYQVLVQRGTASFCTQRSVHGQAIEGIQGAVNVIDYKNFPSVLRSLGCKVFVKHNRINYRTLNKSKHYFRRGTLGGTQDRNTVRKNGKYWNTASKIV